MDFDRFDKKPITDESHPLYGKAREVVIPEEELRELRERLNKKMQKVHREYVRKARQSEIDASKVILTD